MKTSKKSIAIIMATCTVALSPLSVFAAHTHKWGPDMYYGYIDEQPEIWETCCVTRHIYNYHTCLTCGQEEVWESNAYKMNHHFVNDQCTYCGLAFAR